MSIKENTKDAGGAAAAAAAAEEEDSRAVLYDAVGGLWLSFYGHHVHLGECYCGIQQPYAMLTQLCGSMSLKWLARANAQQQSAD